MSAVHAMRRPTAWAPLGRVLLSAWQARRNQGSLWPWGLILTLVVVSPVAFWWALPDSKAWLLGLFVAGAVAGLALLGAWVYLAYNVLQQNHPQLAPTLPAQVRTLRLALGLGVAVLSGLAALATALAGGPVVGVSCAVAAACTMMVCGIRWPRLWIGLAVVGWSAPVWVTTDQAKWLAASVRALPWPVLMGAVAMIVAWALRAVVMNGGERHASHHGRLLKAAALMKWQPTRVGDRPLGAAGWGWALSWGQRAYAARLRRQVGRPQQQRALLAMGLGPQAHWTGVITGVVAGWVFIVAMLLVVGLLQQWEVGRGIAGGLAIGLAFASYTVVLQVPAVLWASRREQALLRLLPGAPQGPALNRWLAWHVSRLHLTAVLMQGLTIAALSTLVVVPGGWGWLQQMMQAALVLSPLAALALWRDWSRLKAPGGGTQLLIVLGAVGMVGLGYAWFGWWGYTVGRLAVLVALLGLPVGLWRWRAINHAPAAWPAGRV